MLKYIYTSPARQFSYLIGRAVAKVCLGLLSTFILLATGALFLGLKLDLGQTQWSWLLVYFILGMIILSTLGIMLGGVALVVARHGGSVGEVSAGVLLLFSGAYFPPDILPGALKVVTLALPVTYWLEGMRRALNGGILMGTVTDASGTTTTAPISPFLAQWDNTQLLLILLLSAVISVLASFFFYRWVEHAAKERGMIDRVTGY